MIQKLSSSYNLGSLFENVIDNDIMTEVIQTGVRFKPLFPRTFLLYIVAIID